MLNTKDPITIHDDSTINTVFLQSPVIRHVAKLKSKPSYETVQQTTAKDGWWSATLGLSAGVNIMLRFDLYSISLFLSSGS